MRSKRPRSRSKTDPLRALDRLTSARRDQHVVITLGAGGVLYGRGRARIRLPAFSVAAVDETGAGDAFIGHLLAAWFDPATSIPERLLRASAAGALATCSPGAASAIPDATLVRDFLDCHALPTSR